MRRFGELFERLDQTNATNEKVAALADYFASVPPADGAWAVYFLSGRRLKRLIGAARLRAWLVAESGLPEWLVEETHQHVGDLAETIALMLEDPERRDADADVRGLAAWVEEELLSLRELPEDEQARRVRSAWRGLPRPACFLYNKLLTGALRVGVSQTLVERALARASGLPRPVIAHRLMGDWRPDAGFFASLFDERSGREDASRPYPFFLAHPLDADPAPQLGPLADWQCEWKWDGIRGQLVRREDAVFLWSRGEEMITDTFPEVAEAAWQLPEDTVLDGELLAWDGEVLPFSQLQRRLGRKRVGRQLRREVPVHLLAYDVLEDRGEDVRHEPLAARRQRLERLLAGVEPPLRLSPLIEAGDWDRLHRLRTEARARRVEGVMLKRRDSPYGIGRPKGPWWKWKVAPLTLDAILIYAQPGHGRRANLYTDYTFAVPDGEGLVPVAKAYSGLDDAEIRRLDRWIRRHTVERFGPVRSVEPVQVFELAFEGIAPSRRHKSGVALRFPRIARWREDLGPADADSLNQVRALLDEA
ncbi:ATP-dependent DNA ligase [Sediminicurvatus halobius]|uniref:DNA ligase (ATP) n=1 Tax=Sediminicurvatus halobius TaxID=2182432 RepID=A0A2U2N5Q1_9GAMM|nr:ATP-dependent DNA ligase [Spiribacter halobius]PWG64314.1 ATP-dependent DNA ligase [Spiribacter halobius]UEX79343.1 ATP-dependent DNA ligase [Spiribacter halobius]